MCYLAWMTDNDPRATARALLESGHEFPGTFEFRVVVRPAAVGTIVTAIAAAVGTGEVDERRSSGGKWVSVRYRVDVRSAEDVLDVYAILRQMPEVVLSI